MSHVKRILLALAVVAGGACHIVSGGDEITVEDDEDDSSGSGNGSSVSVGGGTCPVENLDLSADGAPACRPCVEVECCDPVQQCDQSIDCVDFYWCVDSCDDEVCVFDCEGEYPNGAGMFYNVAGCIDSFCYDECSGVY